MEWTILIGLGIQSIIFLILRSIYSVIYYKKPRSIPPIKNPLLKLSATSVAKKIREREITSQAVVEAYIARIKDVNPFLNGLVDERFAEALNEAKECDRKLQAKEVDPLTLEKEMPLYGVPITVKESCCLKGMSYTACCLTRKGIKAVEDGIAVQSMKQAGAIPLGVTNTPEMCAAINTGNFVYGDTHNPFDRRYSAGGSSGGEGALISSAASVLGIGSDIAGSIRIPAHFNGIFGHKPTAGVVSIKGHFPYNDNDRFRNLLLLGPMARYAEDLHLALKVMSSTSNSNVNLRLDEPVDIKKLKVYYYYNVESIFKFKGPTADVKQCIKKAANYLEDLGADVEQLPDEWFNDILCRVIATFFTDLMPPLLLYSEDLTRERKPGTELLKSMLGMSQYTKSVIYTKLLVDLKGLVPESKQPYYRSVMAELGNKFNELLKENAIFLYPTFPCAATFNNLVQLRIDDSMYCLLANIFHLPATHVPMGLNKEGLPVGLQVISGAYQDRICLAVAKELEKAFGGWIPPPSE